MSSQQQNQAVMVTAFNPDDPTKSAELQTVPLKAPAQGGVQVKIKYAGVNPSDVFSLTGRYPGFTRTLPAVPGIDGMGVVTAVGEGVTGLSPGQRVTAMGWQANQGQGSWQQYVNIKAELVVPLPDSISDETGAQFFVNPMAVVGLLEVASVPAGGWLLVTAAGSTLGKMLARVAQSRGIRVVGTVRRAEQVEEVKAAGAEAVVVTPADDLAQQVAAITGGGGAHAAVDPVSGDGAAALGGALRPGGRVFIYGSMAGSPDFKGSGVDLMFRDVHYSGFWINTWMGAKDQAGKDAARDSVLQLLADGTMQPDTGKVFPLSQWAEAVAHSMKGARGGKVLLQCD